MTSSQQNQTTTTIIINNHQPSTINNNHSIEDYLVNNMTPDYDYLVSHQKQQQQKQAV
ncbi:hypothetical protein PGTUg99_012594 [Puccinia graminis f. sp. tritici]|uniref:Uncharacterized protein n=1 Tax=Puccinia graminis f. sp. tritici TaxID=56615 RepID=A0A5B0S751_PUCGR|nr:hypothetical protein PGTUg99_012594 [Puccinia graminis f. sp. tritici]